MQKYGEVIYKLRKQHKLTQNQLGEKLNVSYQAVSKWENNLSEPDLQTIEKLTEIFGISISQFFELSKDTEHLEINKNSNKTLDINNNINFLTAKPWYLVVGLSILVVVLSLLAILIPVNFSSQQIYDKYESSVFYISASDPHSPKSGTGFFINHSGLAVTTYSNIENCTKGNVRLNNGQKHNITKIVGVDEEKDIAIIQIDVKSSYPVKLGNSNDLKLGDKVFSLTYCQNDTLESATSIITEGLIFKLESSSDGTTRIQTTASIDDANKGGVIFNQTGQVVGIISNKLYISGMGFDMVNVCYPINIINSVERNLNKTMEEYIEMHKYFTFYSDTDILAYKNFISGEKIIPISDPIKDGYTFDGWYTSKNFDTAFDFDKPVIDQTACYAKWIPNTYIIRFDANGAIGEMDDIQAVYGQEITLPENLFTNPHYIFGGWQINGNSTIITDCQNVMNLTSNNNSVVVLKAVWNIVKYTIYFDANGATSGEMNNLVLEYNQVVALTQNNFSRTGYTFEGWLYNETVYQDCQQVSELCDEEKVINFVAIWKPIKYTIIFKAFNEEVMQEFTYDKEEKLLANTFIFEGKHFNYWDDLNGHKYVDCESILNLFSEPTIYYLYASFSANKYYVRYNPEKPGLTPTVVEQTYGFSFKLLDNKYTYEGWVFDGWADKDGNLMTESSYINLTNEHLATVDLYATWRICKYELKYLDINYKVVLKENYEYFDTVTIKDNLGLTVEGYNFDGWRYYNSEEKKFIYFNEGDQIDKLPKPYYSGYAELNSVWKPIKYKIRFNSNGGDSGEMEDITCTYDREANLTKNNFTKDGYYFLYWEYNGQIYLDESEVLNLTSVENEIIVLNAVWEKQLQGKGSKEEPFAINSSSDYFKFVRISNYVGYDKDVYFSLNTSIDFDGQTVNSISKFAGTFEGNGHILSNFTLISSYEYNSLFAVNDGTINNLTLDKVLVNTGSSIGLLTGKNNGVITFCNVNGEIDVVTTQNGIVGGLVSSNSGIIDGSYSNVKIQIDSQYQTTVGGFVGANYENINNCYTENSISFLNVQQNDCNIGGFVGCIVSGEIYYSYTINITEVKAVAKLNEIYVGGFVGIGGNSSNSEIGNCFSKTNLNVEVPEYTFAYYNKFCASDFIGANIGYYSTALKNIYVSSQSIVNLLVNGEEYSHISSATLTSDENLKNEEWMLENLFNILGTWTYEKGYPTLNNEKQIIEINSLDDFLNLNNKSLQTEIKLNCNIDLTGKSFKIIGNYATFDGNGHTISNLKIIQGYDNIFSLFITNYGIIKNLKIENLTIEAESESYVLVGGLVGENYGSIFNSCVYGSLTSYCKSDGYIAGLCAYNYNLIKNCYSNITIYSSSAYMVLAAGISSGEGVIQNCFSSGNIEIVNSHTGYVYSYCGGIANQLATVNNCFSFANLSATSKCHYISVDAISNGTVTNSFGYIQQQRVVNGETQTNENSKTKQELMSKAFLKSLGFNEYVSNEYLDDNSNAVWIISEIDIPKLWFDK